MLSKSVCEKIWHCHREIEAATNLLEEVEKIVFKNNQARAHEEHAKGLKDVFGRDQELELGVPSGENSKRLFRVSLDLAGPIIRAHIANKQSELAELNEVAKLEMAND